MRYEAIAMLALAACAAEARKPTVGHRPQPSDTSMITLAYARDAFVGGWKLHTVTKTTPASQRSIDLASFIDLRFAPARSGQFDVFLVRYSLFGRAHGKRFEVEERRGATFDPEAFTKPVATVERSARSLERPTAAANQPRTALGTNLIATAQLVIPALPEGPVVVGDTWTARRVVHASHIGPHGAAEVEVHYRFDAVEPCPERPAAPCARIAYTADTGPTTVDVAGTPAEVAYMLAGSGVVGLDGTFVTSRGRLTFTIEEPGGSLAGTGVVAFARPDDPQWYLR